MKSIKNNLELLHIKEMMDNDRFCLTNALLDAEKATGDKINDLDIDGIENTVTNDIDYLIIVAASKDLRSYRLLEYKLDLEIWVKNELYRVTNWFTYDKKEKTFNDTEVYADNGYYYNN